MRNAPARPTDPRWLALFEDRYGATAHERLVADLQQPCITFAAIARTFGVTRERVRQWQQLLLPDAPRGHERKRLCARHRRRRRLLEDPLFRTFFRQARAALHGPLIEPILTHDRYRTRFVHIGHRTVALRMARPLKDSRSIAGPLTYRLASCHSAEFLYYRLRDTDFLVVPARDVPIAGTRFIDRPGAPYSAYKNTFDALQNSAACIDSGVVSSREPLEFDEVKNL